MVEVLLLLLLLLFVGVFGVVLGVHLQAAKSKTSCGCGRTEKLTAARLARLEKALKPNGDDLSLRE